MEIVIVPFIFLCWLVTLVASIRQMLTEKERLFRFRRYLSYTRQIRTRLEKRTSELEKQKNALEMKNEELALLKSEIMNIKEEIGVTKSIAAFEIELERAREKLEQMDRIRGQSLHLESPDQHRP